MHKLTAIISFIIVVQAYAVGVNPTLDEKPAVDATLFKGMVFGNTSSLQQPKKSSNSKAFTIGLNGSYRSYESPKPTYTDFSYGNNGKLVEHNFITPNTVVEE